MTQVQLKDALANSNNDIDKIVAKTGDDLIIETDEGKTIVMTPTWRDEYPSGDWGNATGNQAPNFGTFEIGGILFRKKVFDANDAATNNFEFPHDMIISEDPELQPEVHAHFRPTTNATGTVVLFLDCVWSKAIENGQTPTDPEICIEKTATYTITQGSSNYPHYVVSFGKLSPNGRNIGDLLSFKISRKTGEGTYTDDIILEQVALHVPCDTRGSRQMYVK